MRKTSSVILRSICTTFLGGQKKKLRDNIKFILSKDIRLGRNYLIRNGFDLSIKDKIQFVTSMKKYQVDDMAIETLRSTDAGVAFVISVKGMNIYHAGDLNWWNAEGRGELYGEVYGREYKRALKSILNKHFDIGFVPLDSRMGEDGYFLGLDYFIKNIDCDNIFPMHMWDDYDVDLTGVIGVIKAGFNLELTTFSYEENKEILGFVYIFAKLYGYRI